MKKKSQKYSIFKVVCVCLAVVILLTWILKTMSVSPYGEGAIRGDRAQVGLFDLFNYLTALPQAFGYIPLYVLVVGAFYGVLYKTNGYRNLLDKLVYKYEEREWVFLTLVMIIFSVLTSVAGISFALIFLFPFVFATMMLMGYSKTTAVMTTVGSVSVGMIGNTYSVMDAQALINSFFNLSAATDIVPRLITLVLALLILIFNVLRYAKKHKIDEPRKGFLYPESDNGKAKAWPIVLAFDFMLIIMVLSFMSWTTAFNKDWFAKALTSVQEFKIFGFPLLAKLLGGVYAFGSWSYTQLICVIVVITFFTAFLSKLSFEETIDGMVAGLQRAVKPAFMAMFVYLFVYISAYHAVLLTIVEPIMKLTKSFNGLAVFTTSISAIISHFFNVELYYSSYNLVQYCQILFTNAKVYHVIAYLLQTTYGLASIFVPTSAVLVTTLSYAGVKYTRYLKAVWQLLLELFVLIIVVGLILL
jgi:uncharacterized ion transporter superfamily protein YfcC